MRTLFRTLTIILLLFTAFVTIYGLCLIAGALIPVPLSIDTGAAEHQDGSESIYLIDNGYHVEISLPAYACPDALLTEVREYAPDAFRTVGPELFCFGWGDRDFYPGTPTIEDLDIGSTIRALLTPTPAAIRISWYYRQLQETAETVRIPATREQVDLLYQYIMTYVLWDPSDPSSIQPLRSEEISAAYTPSLFIEASGTYSLFFTCNNWTNRALKAAGIPTHLWTPTVWGIGNF
jgi:uncharacterized protein (TIGR02117 family)